MKPLEALKQDLSTKIDQLLEELFTQVEDLERRSLEKDQKINLLATSLTQITEEYETLKASAAKHSTELPHLQVEPQNQKVQEAGDPELIIIYQPQDVFKYPRNIIRWYFNELDFKRLSFENIASSLKGLIELGDCEMIDEFLFYISEERLTTLKEADLLELLSILESYLQVQFEKEVYSTTGVYSLLKSIYKLSWTPLLKDFVETNRPYLEEIIFKIDEESFDFEEHLTLLRIYFDLQLNHEAEGWLEAIFRCVILTTELEPKQAVELLYLSLIYELEEKALVFLPKSEELLKDSSIPELRAFAVFYESYTLKENSDQVLQLLSSLKKEANLLIAPLKVKGFEEMFNRLKPISTPSLTPINDHGDDKKEESPLKNLGYSTNLTRQERWEVLINRAIPELGYQRVINYLNWFIEDKSEIQHKDFSIAISIWEDDLRRLYEHKANEILKQG